MSSRALERFMSKALIWGVILVGASLSFVTGKAAWSAFSKEREVSKTELVAVERYESLIERENALTYQLERFGTERGIEEEIRTRYPVALPGEEVITIVDAKKSGSENEDGGSGGVWPSLLDWFSW